MASCARRASVRCGAGGRGGSITPAPRNGGREEYKEEEEEDEEDEDEDEDEDEAAERNGEAAAASGVASDNCPRLREAESGRSLSSGSMEGRDDVSHLTL